MTYPPPSGIPAYNRPAATARSLATWVLLGYVALFIFFEFFGWLLNGGDFTVRSANADFRSVIITAMPVLAVLLATYVTPELSGAKFLAIIALVEYVALLFFGLITLLVGLGAAFENVDSVREVLGALRYLGMGVAEVALQAVAALVTFKAYQKLGGRMPNLQSGPQYPPMQPGQYPPAQ